MLEAKRGAQIYAATAGRRADHTKRLTEYIRVGEAPPRVIQDIVEAGKSLQASPLGYIKRLRHRNVPLKSVPVAEKQKLPKLTGRPVRYQESRIGAEV